MGIKNVTIRFSVGIIGKTNIIGNLQVMIETIGEGVSFRHMSPNAL